MTTLLPKWYTTVCHFTSDWVLIRGVLKVSLVRGHQWRGYYRLCAPEIGLGDGWNCPFIARLSISFHFSMASSPGVALLSRALIEWAVKDHEKLCSLNASLMLSQGCRHVSLSRSLAGIKKTFRGPTYLSVSLPQRLPPPPLMWSVWSKSSSPLQKRAECDQQSLWDRGADGYRLSWQHGRTRCELGLTFSKAGSHVARASGACTCMMDVWRVEDKWEHSVAEAKCQSSATQLQTESQRV